MSAIDDLMAAAPLRFAAARPRIDDPAPKFLRPTGRGQIPATRIATVQVPPASSRQRGDPAGTAGQVVRGVRGLLDGPIGRALGLDDIPSPFTGVGDAVGAWLNPQPSLAGGIDAVVNAGFYGAPSTPSAAASTLLANEAGVLPGSLSPGLGPGTSFFAAGIGPTLGILGPAALLFGAGLLSRFTDRPSVGENFAVRFGRGGDGGLTVRAVGMDNSGDTVGRDAFAGWSRDVLADALAGAEVTANLDGALVYFPNPRVNGGAGSFGARVGGETRYFASPEAALKAFLTGQHRQGRVNGDLPAALQAIDRAVAARGSLADAAAPAYLQRARTLAAYGGPEWLAAAEAMASKAQRAFQPPGAAAAIPDDVADLLRRESEVAGNHWGGFVV